MPKINKKINAKPGDYNLKERFYYTKDGEYTTDDANNLLVWIRGNSATDLVDDSNVARTVSESNLTAATANKINYQSYGQAFNSVGFNGTDSLISVPDSDDLSRTDGSDTDRAFSISMWVNLTTTGGSHGLFSKGVASSNIREYFGSVNSAGRVQFSIFDESNNNQVLKKANEKISFGSWQNIVMTYDGSEDDAGIKIYINGNSTTDNFTIDNASYAGMENLSGALNIGLGFFSTNSSVFRTTGQIAEFAMWSKEISHKAVKAIFRRKGIGNNIQSGYLNNPPRTLIRDRDAQLNTYPRVKRLGSPHSSYISEAFDDVNTVKFGSCIKDDFNIDPNQDNIFRQVPDANKWLVSSDRVEIRKEQIENVDPRLPKLPGALSLGGSLSAANSRWVRTRRKVKNPTLKFSVFVGPLLPSTAASLRLFRGLQSETLAVQVSKTGSSWTTIPIITANVSNPKVNLINGQLDPTSDIYENPNVLVTNSDGVLRPQYSVVMSFDQLKFPTDPDASFYVRIVQTTVLNPGQPVWAIDNIEIISRDEIIVAQTSMLNSHKSHLSASVASPNFLSNMIHTGSSISSNNAGLFARNDINKIITAFNDDRHVIDSRDRFFDTGVSQNVLPGFAGPLSSKDIIEIDLSTSTDTRVGGFSGDTTHGAIAGGGSSDSHLMVYWNNDLKRWEKIGFPLSVNNFGAATSAADIINILTSSAVGFSSYGVMATGSNKLTVDSAGIDPSAKLLPDSILNSYNRPTDSFGFPFSGRYHATSSQYVTARDVGITQPFLFEKAVLDFNAAVRGFQSTGGGTSLDSLYVQTNENLESAFDQRFGFYTPSFFILTQRPGSFETEITVNTGSKNADTSLVYREQIPSKFYLSSGSATRTFVDDTRELITYGQYSYVVSSSAQPSGMASGSIFIQDILDSPIVRDNFSLLPGTINAYTSVTGSFRLNFPCRSTARISPFSPFYVVDRPGSGLGASALSSRGVYGVYANLRLGKQKDGRGYGGLTSASRTLVNGLGAFTPSKNKISINYKDLPQAGLGVSYTTPSVVTARGDTTDQASPYIIFPEDKLIFGWQAPLFYRSITAGGPSSGASSHMQLFGGSKLKMFGSFIRNNRELHGGINQNLTSDVVHEIIGAEPLTDTFAVATREELTGSFYDDFPENNDPNGLFIFGRFIPPAENNPRMVDTSTQNAMNNSLIPTNRVGVQVKSIVGGTVAGASRHYIPQVGSNVSLSDSVRTYLDARLMNLGVGLDFKMFVANHLNAVPASYGSMQNIYATSKDGARRMRQGGSPKYIFSGKSHGNFADFIQQGRDGAFVDDPSTEGDNVIVAPAVRVTFVTSEYDITQDSVPRVFSRALPREVDNTAPEQFQSSNISLFATSSLPFTDNNFPRNRVYAVQNLEVR